MSSPPSLSMHLASSPTSISSFEVISSRSRSSTGSFEPLSEDPSSDDEIVWSIASNADESDFSTESSLHPASDDDYVLLSRQQSRSQGIHDIVITCPSHSSAITPSTEDALSSAFSGLRLSASSASGGIAAPVTVLPVRVHSHAPSAGERARVRKERRKRHRHNRAARKRADNAKARPANSYPSPAPSPVLERPSSTATLTRANVRSKASDNCRKGTLVNGSYEEAVRYISSFLSDPTSKEHTSDLTLLQALIIELGLCSSPSVALPRSLTAAKAFLKSHAFLNIREYLAARGKGQDALQKVMHPSRKALIKDIKKKRNSASLGWVKKMGLNVLLVAWCH